MKTITLGPGGARRELAPPEDAKPIITPGPTPNTWFTQNVNPYAFARALRARAERKAAAEASVTSRDRKARMQNKLASRIGSLRAAVDQLDRPTAPTPRRPFDWLGEA